MLPSGYLTTAFLLALVPGWTYLRLRSSRNAALPRAGLDQLLEVVSVGVATTGLAVASWVLIPASASRLADVEQLAGPVGELYTTEHTRRLVVTALVVFVLAELLAYALFRFTNRGTVQRLVRETVWAGALGRRGGRFPWIGVELRDGRLIEGQLLAYPVGEESEHRDLALQAPIRVTHPVTGRADRGYSRLILNKVDIANITVALAPQPTPTLGWWGSRWQRLLDALYRKLSVRSTSTPSAGPAAH